jgi:hypothetical protein
VEQRDTTLESLSLRLEVVERQNRTLKRSGLAALLIVAAFAAMGAVGTNQTITAQKIVITDAGGRRRAIIGGNSDGAALAFLNADGDVGASLMVEGKDSTLTLGGLLNKGPRMFLESYGKRAWMRLTEPDGKAVELILEPDGPSLSLLDPSDNGAELSLRKDGPSLSLQGGSNGPSARVEIASGVPRLSLLRGPLTEDAELTVLDSGPALLLGENYDVSASLRASKDGPSLQIEDSQGYEATVGSTGLVTPRTGETRTTSAASLTLFDKEKNVIWKAP